MHGKVIVITGASGALGKVVAGTAIARGARMAGIDHAAAATGPTAERLELGGVDLSDAAQAAKAISAAASHFGRLDALINIAGSFSFETVSEGDPKTWQRLYTINVMTAVNASRAAIPHLIASGAGRIINIGAMGALQAAAGMGPYANRRDMPNADFSAWVTVDELADVILFLASDAASAVTGALLPVRGRV